jgi:ketosteroid isomerase-like protein
MAGKMKRTIEVQEIEASDDIGYVWSTVTTHIQATKDQVITTIFKDITIWKRGTDGAWQLAVTSLITTPPLRSRGSRDAGSARFCNLVAHFVG